MTTFSDYHMKGQMPLLEEQLSISGDSLHRNLADKSLSGFIPAEISRLKV